MKTLSLIIPIYNEEKTLINIVEKTLLIEKDERAIKNNIQLELVLVDDCSTDNSLEIAKELARVSGKNVQDIYKIFEEVAKNNKQFAKQFYKYRDIDYIPYKKDIALQNQVRALANITANMYKNIS